MRGNLGLADERIAVRHGDNQQSTRAHYASKFGEASRGVGNVLENAGTKNPIQRLSGEWQMGDGCDVFEEKLLRGFIVLRDIVSQNILFRNVLARQLASQSNHFFCGIDSEHVCAGFEQIASQSAGSATGIQPVLTIASCGPPGILQPRAAEP